MPTDYLTLALTRIAEKVSNVGTDELSSAQKTANFTQALAEYTRHVPYKIVADITADGTYEYSVPAGWVTDFSSILSIEYPAGVYQDPSDAILAVEKYGIYKSSTTTQKIRFYEITPAAGYTIRVTFTAPHAVTNSTTTVYTNDIDAVCALAAAYCCFDLARRYAQDNESYINADSVDRRGKSEKYLSAGKSLVNEFSIHFNLDKETEVLAASANKNIDLTYPDKIDFLTHPVEER